MSVLNQPTSDSRVTGNAVAAPAVNAGITSTGVIPAGTYRVQVVTANLGTAETTAAGLTNMRLQKSSSVLMTLPSFGTSVSFVIDRVTVDGTVSLNIAAIAAATAGSVYYASIVATRLGV